MKLHLISLANHSDRVWVVPLESWHYFEEVRQEACTLDLSRLHVWRDFELCHWPTSMIGHNSTFASPKFDIQAKLQESRLVVN
jgi:hypothetical protein